MTNDANSMDPTGDFGWQRIESLLGQATDRHDFYRQFVVAFSQESHAEMGMAWNCDQSPPAPICQIERDPGAPTRIPLPKARHDQLLNQAEQGDTALMVSVPVQGGAEPTTEQAILIGPIHRSGATELVEFLLPSGNSVDANQTALRRLADYCRIAKSFEAASTDDPVPRTSDSGDEANESSAPNGISLQQLDQFVSHVHPGLDYGQTASNVVNETRRILQCDRVTYFSHVSGHCRAESISGQPTVNQRSNLVTAMTALVTAVLPSKRAFWYPDEDDIPPQIEVPLEEYVDLSMTCAMVIVPIYRQPDSVESQPDDERQQGAIIGALVIEQASSVWDRGQVEPILEAIVRHSGHALSNADAIRNIPLFSMWRAIGQSRSLVAARNLPKTVFAAAAAIAIVAALFLIQVEHQLTCEGVLRPVQQQRVFAQQNGIVQQIHVQHGSRVQTGDLLVTLQNHDLDIESERLTGELNSLRKRLVDSRSMRIRARSIDDPQPTSQQEIEAQIASLSLQLEVVQRQREKLHVVAPIDGEVLTWDLEHRLGRRPVAQGDLLIEVGDTDGQWQLRLDLPDRKAGHLLRTIGQSDDPLPVEFALALEPGTHFQGHVTEVAKATSLGTDRLPIVRIDVDLDESQIAAFKQSGSTVSAKIGCGRRALGYVWLHQVWEFVQYKVLFPLT